MTRMWGFRIVQHAQYAQKSPGLYSAAGSDQTTVIHRLKHPVPSCPESWGHQPAQAEGRAQTAFREEPERARCRRSAKPRTRRACETSRNTSGMPYLSSTHFFKDSPHPWLRSSASMNRTKRLKKVSHSEKTAGNIARRLCP